MGFDDCRLAAKTTFYHVRINGSLYKEVYGTDLLCLFLKDTDEFLTDNLTLRLWLCDACKLCIITLLCIDTDKIQLVWAIRAKYFLYLIALVFSKESMIHKDTGELAADCLGKHNGRY